MAQVGEFSPQKTQVSNFSTSLKYKSYKDIVQKADSYCAQCNQPELFDYITRCLFFITKKSLSLIPEAQRSEEESNRKKEYGISTLLEDYKEVPCPHTLSSIKEYGIKMHKKFCDAQCIHNSQSFLNLFLPFIDMIIEEVKNQALNGHLPN